MTRTVSPILVLAALATLACSGSPAPEPVAPAEPAPAEPAAHAEGPTAQADGTGPHGHMQQHLDAVTRARDAVIKGDLEGAHGPLRWLEEHRPPEDKLPRGWQPFVAAMQGAAAQETKAASLEEVSQVISDTAAQCGRCHGSMGAKPVFPEVPTPSGEGVQAHMQRHQWAMDRMWEGVIAGDADRWRSGAMVMLEDSLDELGAPDGNPAPGSAADMSTRIHELGEDGLGTVNEHDRAKLYGEMLATCGGCHAQTGGGPKDEAKAE